MTWNAYKLMLLELEMLRKKQNSEFKCEKVKRYNIIAIRDNSKATENYHF